MRVLVTGANGQLGTEIRMRAKFDESKDFTYVDLDNFDLSNSFDVASWFKKQEPFHVVINCAAYTQVDKAENDRLARVVNHISVGILAEECRKMNAQLIHISTDYVFDGKNFLPYREDDPCNPLSAYGKTKLAGEQALITQNIPGIIIRTSWLYSAYGNNFVKTMLKLGKEREELKVVFDQIGSPTYAGDLAIAILKIIENQNFINGGYHSEIFHFSNEGVCSWYDFATTIMELSGLNCRITPIRTEEYPLPAPRPHYSVLDKQKIKSVFELNIPHWKSSLLVCLRDIATRE